MYLALVKNKKSMKCKKIAKLIYIKSGKWNIIGCIIQVLENIFFKYKLNWI